MPSRVRVIAQRRADRWGTVPDPRSSAPRPASKSNGPPAPRLGTSRHRARTARRRAPRRASISAIIDCFVDLGAVREPGVVGDERQTVHARPEAVERCRSARRRCLRHAPPVTAPKMTCGPSTAPRSVVVIGAEPGGERRARCLCASPSSTRRPTTSAPCRTRPCRRRSPSHGTA